jgi:retron-type reverse transcriptase
MAGPTGVKRATQKIAQALETNDFHYIIRADIKSFYRSIPHYKLIHDIKKIYEDPKVIQMLEDVIINPIDTPRGYINPHTGIALRGPLSQLFSAIYLRPVDSAFNDMDVVYARYQDDIIILCKTRSQFNRCRRKLTNVLKERRLELSRKKSRWGRLDTEFHFLGIHYSGTQTPNKTTRIFDVEDRENKAHNIQNRTEQNRFFAIPKFIVKNLYVCRFMHEHFVRPVNR